MSLPRCPQCGGSASAMFSFAHVFFPGKVKDVGYWCECESCGFKVETKKSPWTKNRAKMAWIKEASKTRSKEL